MKISNAFLSTGVGSGSQAEKKNRNWDMDGSRACILMIIQGARKFLTMHLCSEENIHWNTAFAGKPVSTGGCAKQVFPGIQQKENLRDTLAVVSMYMKQK